jgi:DNA-directed RNA polymerase II subunit RPB2
LSYNSFISHLRKINLPMDSSAKVVKPRLLHGSQWGIIDPVDTPDGGNVGFHKHMAICYTYNKWLFKLSYDEIF